MKLIALLAILVIVFISDSTAFAYDTTVDTSTSTTTLENQGLQLSGSNSTALLQQLASSLPGNTTNSYQVKQLLYRLSDSISSNSSSSGQILEQLQSLIGSNNSSFLYDLIRSMQVNSKGGLTINTSELESLFSQTANNPNVDKVSQLQALSTILESLYSFDPSLVQSLFNDIAQSNPELAGASLNGLNSSEVADLQNGLKDINPNLANYIASLSKINTGGLGFPGIQNNFSGSVPIPQIHLESIIGAVATVLIIFSLIVFRKRIAKLLSKQTLPGETIMQRIQLISPRTPREYVIYYYQRMLEFMARKGLQREYHQTHREFASKFLNKREEPYVVALTNLYEKAMFSCREVSNEDAKLAERELNSLLSWKQ